MLDIEVLGSVAPEASISVYFAPNTDQGFVDAVTTAVHDATRKPSVISISWGSAESTWTAQAMQQMEQAFAAAAAMGVTVTVAAGDNGSGDGVQDGLAHVDFPASAPHALACGGTSLQLSTLGQIITETVWNDGTGGGAGGGGVSVVFPVPSYQQNVNIPQSANPGGKTGRGVPDIAGDADPDTGYTVRVDGETLTIGGTSAVAPLWAGLIALLNQYLGQPVGFLQPFLYSAAGMASLREITSGSNGAYSAHAGWNACTGLGSPDGADLLSALKSRPST
jgi:kumamolisin